MSIVIFAITVAECNSPVAKHPRVNPPAWV